MTTFAALVPTQTGVDAGPPNAAEASAGRCSAVGSRLLFVFENASGSPVTVNFEDARSTQQVGAPASTTFADLGPLTVPANDRVTVLLPDATRFKDSSTGLIALTWTGTLTTVTWTAYEV